MASILDRAVGMTFDHDFCYSFFFNLYLGEKRKGEKNNQSRGQMSCLSVRPKFYPVKYMLIEK